MILPDRPIAREEVADHYDELDAFYREVWGEHVHHGLWSPQTRGTDTAVRDLVRHVAAAAEIRRGDRVVDIGSGYGATARQLTAELDADVHAITLSPAQHRHALAAPTETRSPSYHLGDWLSNPFADSSFDVAVAIESTEHMSDKAAAFAHIRRVLVPGGRFAICAWIAADRPAPWMVKRLLEPICREGRLPGMGTEADYRELLASNGLTVDAVEDLSTRVAPTWRHSATRLALRIVSDRRYRQYLWSGGSRNRDFAPSVLRILLAYRVGAMRYLLFVGRRSA